MNLEDFEDEYHSLRSSYRQISENVIEDLEQNFKQEKQRQLDKINSDLDNEIGNNFKTLTLTDKMNFYERYVGRQNLNPYFEAHEITALTIMDWAYIKQLTTEPHPNRVVKNIAERLIK